jgi:hypothetical protein
MAIIPVLRRQCLTNRWANWWDRSQELTLVTANTFQSFVVLPVFSSGNHFFGCHGVIEERIEILMYRD